MDAPLDLCGAGSTGLADLIVARRARIAGLERQVAGQAAELAAQRLEIAHPTERLGAVLAALGATSRRRPQPPARRASARDPPGRGVPAFTSRPAARSTGGCRSGAP